MKTKHKKPRSEKKGHGSEEKSEGRKKNRLPRSMWSGSISFGLVNVPVQLYSALHIKDVHFHLLHAKDSSRVHEKIVCNAEEKEVPRSDLIKGYEVAPGQHIVVKNEEIEKLAPKATRNIELFQFINLTEIDPIYFEKPYYLVPEENAKKSYSLLLEVMRRTQRVGLAKLVMRKKEYLAAIRPYQDYLCLETMHFADEIEKPKELEGLQPVKVNEREIKAATELVESLSEPFEPKKLHDDFREQLEKLIETKAKGQEIHVSPEAEEEKPEVVDLLAALEASLNESKNKKKKAA
ncbi:MAG TPA: Ku protein [Verrucomicrobiae bacterium]|jgi:DNA end-binding protein Ku|nr:Ku protein [Verrucomicrobiae bacterium]